MIPDKTIKDLINRHSCLEKELSSEDIDKIFCRKIKRIFNLNEIVDDAKKYLSFRSDKDELEKILSDQV